MDSTEQTAEMDQQNDYNERWDFPTLTPDNFNVSPKSRTRLSDPSSARLFLVEAFIDYEKVLLFLAQDDRLETILRKLVCHELLSERQLNEFSLPDPEKKNPGRFLRFLAAANASALLAEVVILMGADPAGRSLLRMDNPRVRDLLEESQVLDLSGNSPQSPYSDLHIVKREQISRSPPKALNFSPTPTQPMVFASLPGSPTRCMPLSPSEPTSPLSLKVQLSDMPEPDIQNLPDEASQEQEFPFSVIRDFEANGARTILTRTHTIYRDSSSRCFIAFNIVFQSNQDRFRRAEISMRFLPIVESHQPPMILNIFPNPNQRWSTGPSCDLTAQTKKSISLKVGASDAIPAQVGADLGLVKSTMIQSASNSSLTAAGIATSKLTIILVESRAGDGIIYSFSFAVVLDLKNDEKPDFFGDLRINCQLGNRSWFPRQKFCISEKVFFSKEAQLDGEG